jgi:RNA polymerase sigma factor (sigma-70 family)
MGRHRLASPDIGRIFRGETVAGLSEWQLLARYLERRDEIAFEALVARHGPMVLGVCRRMLADEAEVEDAFQATFLVLVRRARQLGPRDAIGPWLHGVAARVSLRARAQAFRRRRLELILKDVGSTALDTASADRELCEILDQELNRLPSKYRSPVVLCYLEGQTHEEAARQLRWPVGTVKGRLSRARDLLRFRLTRRGLAPSLGALTLALSRDASAACRRELLERTVTSSLKIAMGKETTVAVSTAIASLAEGVLKSMLLNKLKWTGLAVLLSGLALSGAQVIARQNFRPRQNDAHAFLTPVDDEAGGTPAPASAASVESRPAEAVATREMAPLENLKKQLAKAAHAEWESALKEYTRNSTGLERAYLASKRLMDAERGLASPAEKADAALSHFDRMREIARNQLTNPSATDLQTAQISAFAAEAELWLAEAKEVPPERATSPRARAADPGETAASRDQPQPETGREPGRGRGKDPQSRRILAKLEEPILMKFPDDTALEDILKHVKDSTKSPELPKGIPIYIDPIGLQEAEKTMTSTVTIDLDGVPLRRTLQLILAQLGLVYMIEDGMLYITSQEAADQPLKPSIHELSPIIAKVEQAERGELNVAEMKELTDLLIARGAVRAVANAEHDVRDPFAGPAVPPAETEEAKKNKELVNLLLKETRELIEVLKATKQTKKAAEAK